jgi:hypothetical protein
MTILDELHAVEQRIKQLNAVRAHLERYGDLTKHQAVYKAMASSDVQESELSTSGKTDTRSRLRRDRGFAADIEARAKATQLGMTAKKKVRPVQ